MKHEGKRMANKENGYAVPAVEKAIQLLQCLSASREPLGVSEIVRAIDSNKHMVYRLLQTLERADWVVGEAGSKYRLSMQPFRCFSRPLEQMDLRQVARQPLHDLWRDTGESCYLAILDRDRALFIEHLDGTRDVRAHGRVGGQYALTCCAPGKVLLSAAGEELLDAVLQTDLPRNTTASIVKPKELRNEIARVEQKPFAVEIHQQAAVNVGSVPHVRHHGKRTKPQIGGDPAQSVRQRKTGPPRSERRVVRHDLLARGEAARPQRRHPTRAHGWRL
jgi:DNA-binding IclR family transcriptional regulator